jgi:hypothetical protein
MTDTAINRKRAPLSSLPTIPGICAGGIRTSERGYVECLGSLFFCEYLTTIDNKSFCHHPRALEIAQHTEQAGIKMEAKKSRQAPTDVGKSLWKTSDRPSP